jgi:hypothetical protein
LPYCSLGAVGALALLAGLADAHLPRPLTRAVESANGKFVLVVLTPLRDRNTRREVSDYDPQLDGELTSEDLRTWGEDVAREKAIEAKYSQSGLYRNDGSTQPLWLIPYLSACRDIFVSNDGRHVVAAKMMKSTCWDNESDFLVFYKSGKKIAGYDDGEVLPCIWMRVILMHWLRVHLPYDESSSLDDEAGEFCIETNQGDVLAFDLATGKRRVRWSPWPIYFGLPAVAVPTGFWAFRRRLSTNVHASMGRKKRLSLSLRELLAMVALIAGTITALKLWGAFGGISLIIAITGALVARLSSGRSYAWFVGAVATLYGAYMALLLSAAVDTFLFDGYPLGEIWLSDDWKKYVLLGVVAIASIAEGWLAGRWCEPRLRVIAK